MPLNLAEQVALFRSMTAGKRLVVVLDNAVSAGQVRVLLPTSAWCVVLVTSRLRLSGLHADGADLLEVSPLPRMPSVELLARTVGRQRVASERAELDALASLCGGLPIALSVAGARLASRPRWSVARVVAELGDERVRLARLSIRGEASLDAAFDLSYGTLSAMEASVYRLTAEHPGPDFSIGLAAAAAGIPEDRAEDAVQGLVDTNMVEELEEGRYRFHDLILLHARAKTDADRSGARWRMSDWYLHQMTRANMVVIPIRWRVSPVCDEYRDAPLLFRDGGAAIEWLDGHLPHILAVLDNAVTQGWDDLAWQVCEALWELFLYRKHYRQWIASHEVGIAAAARCKHLEAESRLRCQLARAYLDLHRFDDAERECLAALELARRAASSRNESVALEQLGMVAHRCGKLTGPSIFSSAARRSSGTWALNVVWRYGIAVSATFCSTRAATRRPRRTCTKRRGSSRRSAMPRTTAKWKPLWRASMPVPARPRVRCGGCTSRWMC